MTQNSPLSVAILGAGSIGCYLGGQLAKGGANVTFIGRPRFKQALDKNGLTLTHFEREDIVLAPHDFTFALEAKAAKNADVIIITVKSQDTGAAAHSLAGHIRGDALLISFQNGVSNAADIQAALPGHSVLGAVVPFNVTGTAPGRFHCGTEGDLIVQSAQDPRLTSLEAAFGAAGQTFKTVSDVRAVQWGKLLVNLNNALNALYGGPLKAGLAQRPYRKVLAAMIEEGLRVTQNANIPVETFGKVSPQQTIKILRLPNFLYKIIMKRAIKIDDNARSSMLDDLDMGRGSEVDYLQGEIVRLAERTGQTALINAAVMAAVNAAFETGESPKLSGAGMLEVLEL